MYVCVCCDLLLQLWPSHWVSQRQRNHTRDLTLKKNKSKHLVYSFRNKGSLLIFITIYMCVCVCVCVCVYSLTRPPTFKQYKSLLVFMDPPFCHMAPNYYNLFFIFSCFPFLNQLYYYRYIEIYICMYIYLEMLNYAMH